jgi:hypothetical protein
VTVSVANDAVVESIVRTANTSNTAANRRLNIINAPVAAGDPANRDFQINIFGAANRVSNTVTLTGATPAAAVAGYYTFSGTLVDRAGNSTALPTRNVAIDNAAPQITGITIPAVLQGGATVAFGPTGTDDLESISGDLGLTYPQLAFANGDDGAPTAGLPNLIRYRRVPFFAQGGNPKLGLWHNPFQAVTDDKLATPIGPGTLLASSGLTVPTPFVQQIQTVNAGAAPLTPAAVPGNVKPTGVTAWIYDIRATSDAVGGTGPAWADQGRSAALSQPIFSGQVTQPATAKNWGTTGTGGAGIQTWQGFDLANPSAIEFRVTTNTSITNPPFTRVDIVRQVGATEWEFLGSATFAGSLDQGATRFWRYSFSYAGQSQAQFAVAPLANGDIVRAIGVDATGNGLSTRNTTVGLPPAIPTSETVNDAGTPASLANGAAAVDVTLTNTNANSANLTYSCSSNSPFITVQIIAPNICRLTSAGTIASGSVPVSITYSITGSLGGFSNNTITKTVTVNRIP